MESAQFPHKRERVLMEGRAARRLFLGLYARGRLILTEKRLIHISRFGFRRWRLRLSSIAASSDGLCVRESAENLIQVTTRQGKTYCFAVRGGEREAWREMLERALWAQSQARRIRREAGSKIF